MNSHLIALSFCLLAPAAGAAEEVRRHEDSMTNVPNAQPEEKLSPFRRQRERNVASHASKEIQAVRRESREQKLDRTELYQENRMVLGKACKGDALQQDVTKFAFFHVSKCGGTTVNEMLRMGGLTKKGNASFVGEFENSCYQKGYKCNLNSDVFVMGSIRNPFSYYVSQFQMLTNTKDILDYSCIGPELKKRQHFDILNSTYRNNRTSFKRFLNLFIKDLPQTSSNTDCDLSLNSIYDRMLLKQNGDARYHDMIVMEDYWPSLMRTLRRVECHMPGTFNFEYIEKKLSATPTGSGMNLKRDVYPYHCYYDDDTRRLVEEHDRNVLERHGYSWNQFEHATRGSCEHVVA